MTPATNPLDQVQTLLEFADNRLLVQLCGEYDRTLVQLEQELSVQIIRRGNQLHVMGEAQVVQRAAETLRALYDRLAEGHGVDAGDVSGAVRLGAGAGGAQQLEIFRTGQIEIRTRKKNVSPRTKTQAEYVRQLFENEMNFGIGPAGTGKTYIAVAAAVNHLVDGHVDRIILSRPAVEAGEKLGYLPGDMKDKVDPYMQPLYDALNDFLPSKQLARLMEEKRIEIAPLAFMRGRTLSNAFVILDEAQNATEMQMKMFLTRLGEGSRMAITGDRSQIDLPRGQPSGLVTAERILRRVKGIGFSYFSAVDVVRHPLVARIVEAYERDQGPQEHRGGARQAGRWSAHITDTPTADATDGATDGAVQGGDTPESPADLA